MSQIGHLASACRTQVHGSHTSTSRKSHGNTTHARATVEQSVSSEVEEDLFHVFNIGEESDTDCFDLTVNNVTIRMLPDSGAQVNLLPKEIYDKNCKHLPKLQPCVRSVFPYMSSKPLDTCGEFYSDIYEPVFKKCIHRHIVVVETKGIPLLCKNDSIELGLIQIGPSAPVAHEVQTDSGKLCDRLKRVNPEVFVDKPGKLIDSGHSISIVMYRELFSVSIVYRSIREIKSKQNSGNLWSGIYTAAQKFPFKIAKQASTMNPDIISKLCTYTNSVTMPVY